MTTAQKARYTQKIEAALGDGHKIVHFPRCIAIMYDGQVVQRFRREKELLAWLKQVEDNPENA